MELVPRRIMEICELVEERNQRHVDELEYSTFGDRQWTFLQLNRAQDDDALWEVVAGELGITVPELRAWFDEEVKELREFLEECFDEDHDLTPDQILESEEASRKLYKAD